LILFGIGYAVGMGTVLLAVAVGTFIRGGRR